MPKKIINPFKNESDSLQIGDLTVENRMVTASKIKMDCMLMLL